MQDVGFRARARIRGSAGGRFQGGAGEDTRKCGRSDFRAGGEDTTICGLSALGAGARIRGYAGGWF